MDYNSFDLKKLEFIKNNFWKRNYRQKTRIILRKIVIPNSNTYYSPVKRKPFSKKGFRLRSNISVLSRATKIIDSNNRYLIKYHSKQLFNRLNYLISIYLLVMLPVAILLVSGFQLLASMFIKSLIFNDNQTLVFKILISLLGSIFFILLLLLFLLVIIRGAFKLGFTLTKRKFADTLCINSVLNILVELYQDDVLSCSRKKVLLQSRIDELAINTNFLQYKFLSKNDRNQKWSSEHFQNLISYIREREKWIIAPSSSTLHTIRQDFYNLAKIYLSGNYGEFKWSETNIESEIKQPSFLKQSLSHIPKFLGVILPLLAMGYALMHPEILPENISVNLISLIFIAWLLLAIDATLKLGIVSGIVNLAKEIKSLN